MMEWWMVKWRSRRIYNRHESGGFFSNLKKFPMKWLYFRIEQEPFTTLSLFQKNLDKRLTKEYLSVLKKKWIICREEAQGEFWGWWYYYEELSALFTVKTILSFIFKVIPFLWNVTKNYFQNLASKSIKPQYTIILIFRQDSTTEFIEDYNQLLISLNQVWKFIFDDIKINYPYINLSIHLELSLWFKSSLIAIYLYEQDIKYYTRLNFYLSRLIINESLENRITFFWPLIKRSIGEIRYENSWWVWTWERKNFYFLLSANTILERLKHFLKEINSRYS